MSLHSLSDAQFQEHLSAAESVNGNQFPPPYMGGDVHKFQNRGEYFLHDNGDMELTGTGGEFQGTFEPWEIERHERQARGGNQDYVETHGPGWRQGRLISRSDEQQRNAGAREARSRSDVRVAPDSPELADLVHGTIGRSKMPMSDITTLGYVTGRAVGGGIIDGSMRSARGVASSGQTAGESRIVLSTDPDNSGMNPSTLMHEIGHVLHLPPKSQVSQSPAGEFSKKRYDPVNEGVADGYMRRMLPESRNRPVYGTFNSWTPREQASYLHARKVTETSGVPLHMDEHQMRVNHPMDIGPEIDNQYWGGSSSSSPFAESSLPSRDDMRKVDATAYSDAREALGSKDEQLRLF